MRKTKARRNLAAAAYALAVTFAVGRWASCMAFLERGYEAAGGEFLMMPVVCIAAWKAINYLFNTMEDLDMSEKARKKSTRSKTRAPYG